MKIIDNAQSYLLPKLKKKLPKRVRSREGREVADSGLSIKMKKNQFAKKSLEINFANNLRGSNIKR